MKKKQLKGIFVSDIHLPFEIKLDGVLDYIKDMKPDVVILGGDIIDADGLHSSENMRAEDINVEWYKRDVALLTAFLTQLKARMPKHAKLVFLEGNHEERYRRVTLKYPKVFIRKDGSPLFDLARDAVNVVFADRDWDWIDYGNYDSFYRIGDALFAHGTIYPDGHAKKYAAHHSPDKIIYGHIHDFQAYTNHRADPNKPATYGICGGCLCEKRAGYKKGCANKWVSGFISFLSTNGITVPTVHLIEQGIFNIGAKVYGRLK